MEDHSQMPRLFPILLLLFALLTVIKPEGTITEVPGFETTTTPSSDQYSTLNQEPTPTVTPKLPVKQPRAGRSPEGGVIIVDPKNKNLSDAQKAILAAINQKRPPPKVGLTNKPKAKNPSLPAVPSDSDENSNAAIETDDTMTELSMQLVKRCLEEAYCLYGDRCQAALIRRQKLTDLKHDEIVRVRKVVLTASEFAPFECDVIAKFENADRQGHHSLEYRTTDQQLHLPLIIDSGGNTTFKVENGKLTCSPNCTMNTTSPYYYNKEKGLYFFKIDYFKWESKKRADMKWCLLQTPPICYTGRYCAFGNSKLPSQGESFYIYEDLRKRILASAKDKEATESCKLGAIIGRTNEKGVMRIDYHTTSEDAPTPIQPTYAKIKHNIYVADNDSLVCQESFCYINTFYSTSYTENGVKFYFFTGEIRTTAGQNPDVKPSKPAEGGSGESGPSPAGLSKEKDKDKKRRRKYDEKEADNSNMGQFILIGIVCFLVLIILALVAGLMFQRYQKEKTKHREEIIQARIKTPKPASKERVPLLQAQQEPTQASTKETTTLITENQTRSDPIESEKSAKD